MISNNINKLIRLIVGTILTQFSATTLTAAEPENGTTGQRKLERAALVFLIAGQSNAGGVAAFSPESNVKSGLGGEHPTIPGSTAKEVGIPTTMDAYPRSYIWKPQSGPFERLTPEKNLQTCYRDPWRHGIELMSTSSNTVPVGTTCTPSGRQGRGQITKSS